MPAEWNIQHWPECLRHVFLSHCQEDRQDLVRPVFDVLASRGFLPWIDELHYPLSRSGFETLREELLTCRHVVYFLTPAAMKQSRGWMQAERAYADAIQGRFTYHGEIAHFEVPLMFIPPGDAVYQRSSWRALRDKSPVCPLRPNVSVSRRFKCLDDGRRGWTAAHVQWAADTITAFIQQEESWARELAVRFAQDDTLANHFSADMNLRRRLLAESPPAI